VPLPPDPELIAAVLEAVAADQSSLIWKDPAMERVVQLAAQVARSDAPVLVTGESGTGKEVIARHLHQKSLRKDRPFVAVNCGALTTASAEQELFGLNNGHQGLITSATGGTLLLDELGDLPLMIQASLLRVLEDHNVRPVGSLSSKIVDIRIIAATNRDLSKNTVFRTDLLHRFTGIMLTLPALIEHVEDIPQIAGHLLARCAGRTGRPLALTDAALAVLMAHDWPGNGRELRQEGLARGRRSAERGDHRRHPRRRQDRARRRPQGADRRADACPKTHRSRRRPHPRR
jgi:DNA-binding NtrC family response regulator